MTKKILKATHAGVLEIGEIKIPCYVLEDGSRVFAQRGIASALGMAVHSGNKLTRFLGSQGIKPFVSNNITEVLRNTVLFTAPQGGPPGNSITVTILPDIAIAVLDAKKANVLQPQQQHIVDRCEILLRLFAKIGIIALVDEATGFDKERFEYRELFKVFLRESAAPHEKLFPDEIYDVFYKYPKTAKKNQHPLFFAKLTRKYIYEPLAGSNGVILEMLDERNPMLTTSSGTKKRKHRFFQFMEKIGKDVLLQHIWQLIGIGKASPNKTIFDRNFNRTFSKNFQNEMFGE